VRKLLRRVLGGVLLLLAAVVVLACVLLFNAFNTRTAQLTVTAQPRLVFDEQAAAQRLSSAIRFQTVSNFLNPDQNAAAFRALHAHIEAGYPAFHKVATRETVGNLGLLYTWEGSDKSLAPIALLAHQDVVLVAPGTEGDWQAPPFEGAIKDGFIWGRGAWDDKGNLFAMLEGAELLAASGFKPKRTIYFAFGQDEEVGGQRGGKAIANLLKSRGAKLDFVLDEGLLITDGIIKGLNQPAALIGISEKGYATLTLTATAVPGHSSMPPRETAIGMLSAALARLEDQRMPAEIRGITAEMFATLAPEMSLQNRIVLSNLWLLRPLLRRELEKSASTEAGIRTTTALTIFNAGNQENVLPGRAEATVNFRLVPGDTRQSVTEHVRKVIGNEKIAIAAGRNDADPPPVSPTNGAAYRTLNTTIREIFPNVVVAPGLMVGATDSRHFAGVTDNVFRFSPVIAKQEDLSRFHGTNERISVENYADMIRFYRRLMQNSAG
jgi:carboxypeptidase PM20D1